MTATFTPDSGSLTYLAGQDAGSFDQPTGQTLEARPIVSTTPLVRATAPHRAHRGNSLWTFHFRATVSYSTWDLAVAGNIALAVTCASALGTFVLKNAAGSTILTLNDADVSMTCSDGGALSIREFTITGIKA